MKTTAIGTDIQGEDLIFELPFGFYFIGRNLPSHHTWIYGDNLPDRSSEFISRANGMVSKYVVGSETSPTKAHLRLDVGSDYVEVLDLSSNGHSLYGVEPIRDKKILREASDLGDHSFTIGMSSLFTLRLESDMSKQTLPTPPEKKGLLSRLRRKK